MKLLVAATAAVVILAHAVAHAGTDIKQVVNEKNKVEGRVYVRPFCKLGKQFLVVIKEGFNASASSGVSVIQVKDGDGTMPCREDSTNPVTLN